MTTRTLDRSAVGEDRPPAPPRRRGRPVSATARRRERFAYSLIAPALGFMVLVHLIPTAAGTFLSFLDINTFTFQQLFGAPWVGFQNYDSILFDSANPL
ncbi:MAG TPA: hypothetical protein VG795_03620, partial [Acidimicrobiia bacterium]|nr:hypothetical protein [Acidimicrobiia bacterium]